MMKVHNLLQGTPEWHEFRLNHFGASEAGAMLGLSKSMTRDELLHMKKTGTAREFSEWVQKKVLDRGHELENSARPHVENLIAMALYPVTGSDGVLSASFDGLTISGRVGFEHKQWNEGYATMIKAGQMPEEHMPQVQQQLMVSKAEKVIFVMSDGTREKMVWIEVTLDPTWVDRIQRGWTQFQIDLDAYDPSTRVVHTKLEGKTRQSLPALRVQAKGEITASNLEAYKEHALQVIESVCVDPKTDQQFADAKEDGKWLREVEAAMKTAKAAVLGEMDSVDAAVKVIEFIGESARRKAIAVENAVTKGEKEIKDSAIESAQKLLDEHVLSLNKRLGQPWIPRRVGGFAEAAKGKRNIATMQSALNTALANAKIEASEIADRLQANHAALLRNGRDWSFLFADFAIMGTKPLEDFAAIAAMRIRDHEDAEAARLARASVQPEPAPAPAPAAPATNQPLYHRTPTGEVEKATLKLGDINARLDGPTVTAEFLQRLGYVHAAKERAALLYRESDWPGMCAAIANHVAAAARRKAA